MEIVVSVLLVVGVLFYLRLLASRPKQQSKQPVSRPTRRIQFQAFADTREAQLARHDVSGGGEFSQEIVGESHYQDVLSEIARLLPVGWRHVTAQVALDDGNPHDPRAVAVRIGGLLVGYLSRDDARLFRSEARRRNWPLPSLTCAAALYGGSPGKPSYGVWLDLPNLDQIRDCREQITDARELERDGETMEAIAVYLSVLADCPDEFASYDRLTLLYTKQQDWDAVLRIAAAFDTNISGDSGNKARIEKRAENARRRGRSG